ncbi:type IV inositol polyphosphate 5-phosphatase 11-like [Cryptomeria japonica]|uniref:type IV inositol polyphosphate 5-phosphatase 11-like n=1 Tax=Cryptomeria japonica TaxID=3369 RepID=UPI0027DAA4B6|nr:type IV inositol polyphosphate 5-phosphatase 11-like [Cryptomeria japonica]
MTTVPQITCTQRRLKLACLYIATYIMNVSDFFMAELGIRWSIAVKADVLMVLPKDKERKKSRRDYREKKTKHIIVPDTIDFVEKRKLCEEETVDRGSDLCMYIVTWNMNGKVACHDLVKLLGRKRENFDFYVVGLQEAPHGDIASLIQKALGHDYSKVSIAIIQSLQLYIFGKKYWDPLIRDVRVDKIRSGGLGGVVRRQKGAVAISFHFIHASFIFISCHLAPHENNVEERNSQYQRISQTIFSDSQKRMQINPLGFPKKETKVITPTSLETSDMVVWLGDLNYRVEGSRKSVAFLINQNLQQLQAKDQLSREAKKGEIFHGFCEGPLSFRPTYKYDIGTDNYDTSAKRRVPSWTDRILYKINSPAIMKAHVEEYDCIESIKGSDHRPVKVHLYIKFRRPLMHALNEQLSHTAYSLFKNCM